MNNKYEDKDEPNEKSMIQLVEHLVVRDDTGVIIMNKRQTGNERTK